MPDTLYSRSPAPRAPDPLLGITTMNTRILSSLLSLALAPLALAGGTLKIVSSLPRTGSANAQTTSMVNGIKMAIDEVGGQVDGFKIEYEDMDDASPQRGNWDPAVEAQNANKACVTRA